MQLFNPRGLAIGSQPFLRRDLTHVRQRCKCADAMKTRPGAGMAVQDWS